jgi:hypothetical protein
VWIVPSELGEALKGIGGMLGGGQSELGPDDAVPPRPPVQPA